MSKHILGSILAASCVATLGFASPAAAQNNGYSNGYYQQVRDSDYRYSREDRRYRRAERRATARNYRYNDRRYNNDKRYRCDSGAKGAVIGGVAGGLLGHEVAKRHDKTAGTIIGGVLGALAGRAIDRSGDRQGC